MNPLALSHRLLWRQGRSGALVLLLLGLTVATAALTAVSLFTDRVGRALEREAAESLAADLVITSRSRPDRALIAAAERYDLQTAEVVVLSTAVFAGDDSRLIDVKGVTPGYPLRGQLRLTETIGGEEISVRAVPPPGEVWLEPRGLRQLDAELGDTLEVGALTVTIRRALTFEPDRGGSQFMLAPRLIMNFEDVERSQLLGAGTRARYRLLVAGEERQVAAFQRWAATQLERDQTILTVSETGDQTAFALNQARRFLGVAALTAVILSAVAVLLSALRFAAAQRDLVALLKAFGAHSDSVVATLALMLLWLVLAAVVLGAGGGLLAQYVIAEVLALNMTGPLPPPRAAPVLQSGLFTVLLAAGFALPPLMGLRAVPPMRILNRSLDAKVGLSRLAWLVPVLGALAIPTIQLGEWRLALIVLGGAAVLAAALALSAWLAMLVTRRLARHARASWRFGLAGLHRRRGAGVVQITALGLGLMALLLLMVVRSELLEQWQASLPADTPNHFVVNIQPDQQDLVREQLLASGAERLQIGPMASANLLSIAGREPPDDRMAGQVNVSWTDTLPPANTITAGQFFDASSRAEVSLAEMWAQRLGVELGDELVFESGAQQFTATVTSLREVDWTTFSVNFFILLTPEAGEVLPHQLIASFYLDPDRSGALRALNRAAPNLSILDIGAVIERVLEIIERVSAAAQVVFLFTLLAGIVVLLAALEATRDERRHESALIRTLGADDALVRRGLLIEYGIMAVIAALLATLGAAVTGWLLAEELFEFRYRPSPGLFAIGFTAAIGLVVGSGWLGNRSVLATPPIRILRGQ